MTIVFPIACFYVVKYLSEKKLILPKRYFYDNVAVKKEDGKMTTDTTWHEVADFNLQTHLGQVANWDKYSNKIIVANFFYTQMDKEGNIIFNNMKFLQDAFKKKTPVVQLLSFTVNPEFDTKKVLKDYADMKTINHSNWDLLTGDKEQIYNLAQKEMKLGVGVKEDVQGEEYIYSQNIVLLDKKKIVRGFYNGMDSAEVMRLAEDVVFLSMEK